MSIPLQATAQAPTTPVPPTPALPATPGGQGTGPVTGEPTITLGPDGRAIVGGPMSRSEIEALRDQRGELSDQLVSAANRREELAKELQTATGVNKAGLEGRIQLLDARILYLEAEIARTGSVLANSLALSPGGNPDLPFPRMRPDLTAISIVFTIFVMAPIALAMARLLWKRASSPKSTGPSFERENHERLQRLEAAVDSIAIEMERVSEGQRFVTKLLAEGTDRHRLEAPR